MAVITRVTLQDRTEKRLEQVGGTAGDLKMRPPSDDSFCIVNAAAAQPGSLAESVVG